MFQNEIISFLWDIKVLPYFTSRPPPYFKAFKAHFKACTRERHRYRSASREMKPVVCGPCSYIEADSGQGNGRLRTDVGHHSYTGHS